MPQRRTKLQLAAIAQADAILETAEDKQIKRINEALVRSFSSLKQELESKWSKHSSGDTFATDRGILLAAELKSVLNVLAPKAKQTKDIKKQFSELLTLSDQNGNELAGQLLSTYEDSRGLAVDSTATISPDVLAEVSQEAYDRLLKYGTQFAQESSIIVQQGIIQGWGVGKTSRALASRLGTTKTRAEMIVRTESGKAANRAANKRYAKEEVKLVQHISTQDSRVCPICASRSGQIYEMDGYDAIMHPHCRCKTIPIKQEWIDAGLFDLEWAERHHKDAIAKAGSENNGPSPFEKNAGLKAPKPWWKPGDKIKAPNARGEAIRRLSAPTEWTEGEDAQEALSDFLSFKYVKQDSKVTTIKGVAKYVRDDLIGDLRTVKYDANDGTKKYKAEWSIARQGYFSRSPLFEVPSQIVGDLKTLGATGALQTVDISIDGRYTDNSKTPLSEKQRVRRAVASKRAWGEILKTIPAGTLLHNDPIGGKAGKRARFYRKNGFGEKSVTGQYGLVIEEDGKKKVIPVTLDRSVPIEKRRGNAREEGLNAFYEDGDIPDSLEQVQADTGLSVEEIFEILGVEQ